MLQRFARFLTEADYNFPPARPSAAAVTYYAVTPSGTRTMFTRTIALMQVRGSMSETAILYYLRDVHKGCDIIIHRLSFV